LEDNFEHSEVICVNDCSEDKSLAIIKETGTAANNTSVSVVNMSYFHGLEVAMNAGMDIAIGDFVFEFDNTVMDYDQAEIMNVYKRSLQGYDIVSAAPDKRERFTSKMFYRVFKRFANMSYNMRTESFRVLSRRVINRISSMNKTVPYRKAIYAGSGLKTDTIVYKVLQPAKTSDIDRKEIKYRKGLAVDSLILFTEFGYRLSIAMTVIMMLISVFMTAYSIVIYTTSNPIAGWTTTILFLSVAFFGLFGILTIIIKYLQLLVNLVFKRKQYSFESIEKLTK
jgi:dolichol-phosphate mannosyltransferase